MSLEVREANVQEYDRVAEIMLAAYGSVPGFQLDLAGAYAAELADVAGRAAVSPLLVAVEVKGEFAGTVLGAVTYIDDPASPYAEPMTDDEAAVRMLAVHPRAQGRGVGRALMETCIERARHAGRARVVLHTTEWMITGHRLYERLGFRRALERDAMVEDRIHLLGYVLDLEP